MLGRPMNPLVLALVALPDETSANEELSLNSVYYPTCSILEASLEKHTSQVWRSIVEGMDNVGMKYVYQREGEWEI